MASNCTDSGPHSPFIPIGRGARRREMPRLPSHDRPRHACAWQLRLHGVDGSPRRGTPGASAPQAGPPIPLWAGLCPPAGLASARRRQLRRPTSQRPRSGVPTQQAGPDEETQERLPPDEPGKGDREASRMSREIPPASTCPESLDLGAVIWVCRLWPEAAWGTRDPQDTRRSPRSRGDRRACCHGSAPGLRRDTQICSAGNPPQDLDVSRRPLARLEGTNHPRNGRRLSRGFTGRALPPGHPPAESACPPGARAGIEPGNGESYLVPHLEGKDQQPAGGTLLPRRSPSARR